MNYIEVENPEIAKDRVKVRVSKGGHGISGDTVERRYYSSLKNLKAVIEVCYEINIYDNTEIFKEILDYKDGTLIWEDKNMPNWSNNLLDKWLLKLRVLIAIFATTQVILYLYISQLIVSLFLHICKNKHPRGTFEGETTEIAIFSWVFVKYVK